MSNADLVTSRDVKGFTPLHWAAYFGHEAVLELLLENEKLRESWSCDLVDLIHGVAEEEGKIMQRTYLLQCRVGRAKKILTLWRIATQE